MTEERAIEILGIMKSQMKEFGMTARFEGLREMQEETVDVAVKALSEIQQYRAIGTVEECREARERQKPEKPIRVDMCTCPNCDTYNDIVKKRRNTVNQDIVFCWHCGQAMEIKRSDVAE